MGRAIRIAAELRAESVLLCHRSMTNSGGAQDFWNSQEYLSLKFSHFPLCSGEIVEHRRRAATRERVAGRTVGQTLAYRDDRLATSVIS